MKKIKTPPPTPAPVPDSIIRPDASGIPVHCAHDALADVTGLVPHPRNPNRHPESQIAVLAKIIRQQGWRAPVVVSRRSGFIVSGHGRVEAARLLQVERVPVNYQDFPTESAELEHLIADNRLAELSDMDESALRSAMESLREAGEDLDLTGFAGEDLDSLLTPESPKGRGDGGLNFNITFSLTFEDAGQQQRWYDLLRIWKDRFGNDLTVGQLIERVADHEESSTVSR